jgi:hypothetical protein
VDIAELKGQMETDSYIGACCGKEHSGVPLSFAADFPDSYANLSREDRDIRAVVGSDQCIIDQEQFYIRGCIDLPVDATVGVFLWGVWARVHQADFDEISDHWETQGRERKIGHYKGRLANSLSIYPETFNMKLEIQIEPVGTRPKFRLEELEHPLCVEQRNGLTLQKAQEYACLLLRMAKV